MPLCNFNNTNVIGSWFILNLLNVSHTKLNMLSVFHISNWALSYNSFSPWKILITKLTYEATGAIVRLKMLPKQELKKRFSFKWAHVRACEIGSRCKLQLLCLHVVTTASPSCNMASGLCSGYTCTNNKVNQWE